MKAKLIKHKIKVINWLDINQPNDTVCKVIRIYLTIVSWLYGGKVTY